jgi:hypothetical protein
VEKLASRDYLNVGRSRLAKPLVLDLTNPAHNIVACVIVLSYSIQTSYPKTGSPEEQLVKSLSAYNHGSGHPDYNQPWLQFVRGVDPKKGEDAKVSAVNYGIGMKFYLGIEADAAELDWWATQKGISMQRVFFLYADPYYAYAHFN